MTIGGHVSFQNTASFQPLAWNRVQECFQSCRWCSSQSRWSARSLEQTESLSWRSWRGAARSVSGLACFSSYQRRVTLFKAMSSPWMLNRAGTKAFPPLSGDEWLFSWHAGVSSSKDACRWGWKDTPGFRSRCSKGHSCERPRAWSSHCFAARLGCVRNFSKEMNLRDGKRQGSEQMVMTTSINYHY